MNKDLFTKKGFTLVEVVIATALFALIIGAAIMVENQSLKAGTISRHRLQASGIAQGTLNLIRRQRDLNEINEVKGLVDSLCNPAISAGADACPRGTYNLNGVLLPSTPTCNSTNQNDTNPNCRWQRILIPDNEINKEYEVKIILR